MESKIIVLFEHESSDWRNLEMPFQNHGFYLIHAETREAAVKFVAENKADALVLDWRMGRMAIQSLIHEISDLGAETVLVVLARQLNYRDQISLLEQGVDECFDESLPGDLLGAKVSALMRRVNIARNEHRTLRAKDVTINLDTHEVFRDGKLIELTFTQFKILYLLASKRDYVFTRDEILNRVWGDKSYVTDRTVDVHVKRLREKLGDTNRASDYIQTIHGLGYRFA